ncbi:transcriptional regulator, TetR family protein [Pusillimonas sp. T7-7]|uniref:flavin reductase n=1 Tax=Pusillimonas sp. (strain T7-7) TaxID=1007105 RepID=UPI0002084F65|nr:flavin reductase [Pusillimonas sp. T7-7]AEC21225.1 transcriptional regulator, TetR family protein [Pusillimonas sp. T7-7]
MALLQQEFVAAMRRFPGAANLITTGTGDSRRGLTATACMSLTAEPPQIGVAVSRSASAYESLVENGCFCVNSLACEQHDLAARFAGPIKGAERFEAGEWTTLATGAPALDGAVVNLDCEISDRLELSTHTLFVGRVVAARYNRTLRSLLYVDGDWASLLPSTGGAVDGLMEGIDTVSGAIDQAMQSSPDSLENLTSFVKDWTQIYTDRYPIAQKYMSVDLYASPENLQAVNRARREFDDKLTGLIQRGIEDGRLEVDDARLTAFAISGLVGWIHRWFRPDGRLTPAEIGDHLAVLVQKMVAKSNIPTDVAPSEEEVRL